MSYFDRAENYILKQCNLSQQSTMKVSNTSSNYSNNIINNNNNNNNNNNGVQHNSTLRRGLNACPYNFYTQETGGYSALQTTYLRILHNKLSCGMLHSSNIKHPSRTEPPLLISPCGASPRPSTPCPRRQGLRSLLPSPSRPRATPGCTRAHAEMRLVRGVA